MLPLRKPLTHKAFTLIELLVVIAIIGILAAILIPTISTVREKSLMAENTSNLRQLHSVAMQYANDNQGRLPLSSASNTEGGGDNFYTILQNTGYFKLQNIKKSSGDYYLFNPVLVQARKEELMDSCAASYAINFWATGGATKDGAQTRDSSTKGRLANVELPAQMALFMDGRWNGKTWPVQIGNWAIGDNNPDFSFPAKLIGTGSPESATQVVFVDGHVETIERKNFKDDLDTPFWKGRHF